MQYGYATEVNCDIPEMQFSKILVSKYAIVPLADIRYRPLLGLAGRPTEKRHLFMQLVALESYRDLVKLMQRGLDDAQGIRAAQLENIELRAQAKTAAAAAAGVPVSNSRPAATVPPGILFLK